MAHKKTIDIIGYACGHGAGENACAGGPQFIKEQQIFNKEYHRWQPIYRSEQENTPDILRRRLVEDYCYHLKTQVTQSLTQEHFPITIGGDHSMAIGTWAGVRAAHPDKKIGLVWFDAHMDAHTRASSPSGNVHGMPLAYLLGHGSDAIAKRITPAPILQADHVYMIGLRSYEAAEEKLLRESGVHIYYMDDVKEKGLRTILANIREELSQKVDLFGVSIDVDAFDPSIAPGTGTTEGDGLQERAIDTIQTLLESPDLCALEIAEFNPSKDKGAKTLDLINKLCKVFL